MDGEKGSSSNDAGADLLEESLERLQLENQVLEHFLWSAEPELVANFARDFDDLMSRLAVRERLRSVVSALAGRDLQSLGARASLRRDSLLGRRSSPADEALPLAARSAAAARVLEDLSGAARRLHAANRKQRRLLAFQTEETQSRCKEILSMIHKFEENVMVDGDLSKESFFNFLSTQLKRLDQQIVLLSLHKNTLLRKSKSLRAELPNLEEMRKNLFAVDVDIQNISTEQAVKRFEEQEVQIPKRKAMLTQIGKVLRRRAEGLAGTERRLRETEGRLSSGARKVEALRSELRAVAGQEMDARAGLERMRRVAGGYRAPPPLDYVRAAEELGHLRKQLAEWRHRKRVQDATLASLEKDVGAAMRKIPEHLRLKFRRMMRRDQVDSPADVDESASPTLLPAPSEPR